MVKLYENLQTIDNLYVLLGLYFILDHFICTKNAFFWYVISFIDALYICIHNCRDIDLFLTVIVRFWTACCQKVVT